ncbi:MAG: branched-chain amino acid ABC transporter permease [Chloroflexota bacterium]|nr:branched-chain amino acid ABC transporter permease [Chloroflexota bacterium]
MLALLPQVIVVGLLIGAVYSLMALGITFIASIMKLINWAMGEFYMLGSYLQFLLISRVLGGGLWWVALPLAALGTFLLGMLIQRLLLAPMFERGEANRFEYATIVTIALSVLFQNLAVLMAGPNQSRPPDYVPTLSLPSLGLALNGSRLAAAVAAAVILTAFWFFVRRTTVGLAFLGVAQNRLGAQTAGINLARIDMLAFGIGVALAAAAGALLAPVFLVYPTNGATAAMKGFEIIVIGGLGSLPGAVIGAFGLALIESLGSVFISPAYQDLYGFVFLIAFLVLRPQGLFGERERRV